MRWLDGIHGQQAQGYSGGQRSLACCSPWGHEDSDTTEQLNNNNNNSTTATIPTKQEEET